MSSRRGDGKSTCLGFVYSHLSIVALWVMLMMRVCGSIAMRQAGRYLPGPFTSVFSLSSFHPVELTETLPVMLC